MKAVDMGHRILVTGLASVAFGATVFLGMQMNEVVSETKKLKAAKKQQELEQQQQQQQTQPPPTTSSSRSA